MQSLNKLISICKLLYGDNNKEVNKILDYFKNLGRCKFSSLKQYKVMGYNDANIWKEIEDKLSDDTIYTIFDIENEPKENFIVRLEED